MRETSHTFFVVSVKPSTMCSTFKVTAAGSEAEAGAGDAVAGAGGRGGAAGAAGVFGGVFGAGGGDCGGKLLAMLLTLMASPTDPLGCRGA